MSKNKKDDLITCQKQYIRKYKQGKKEITVRVRYLNEPTDYTIEKFAQTLIQIMDKRIIKFSEKNNE